MEREDENGRVIEDFSLYSTQKIIIK